MTPPPLSEARLRELEEMAQENASEALAAMPPQLRMDHALAYAMALSEEAPALLAEIRRHRGRKADHVCRPEPEGSMAALGLRLRKGLADGAKPRDLAMSREEILQAALALEFHDMLVRTVRWARERADESCCDVCRHAVHQADLLLPAIDGRRRLA